MKHPSKNSFLATLENSFAAAALTEADLDTAQEFLKQRESSAVKQAEGTFQAKIKLMLKSFENCFAAAAMAEGNTQMAMEFLKVKTGNKRKTSLDDFLHTVGLKGVRVQYRIAMVQ